MKTEYKPIAMRCSKKQFESIKDLIPLPIDVFGIFYDDTYLTNNYVGDKEVGITRTPHKPNREVIDKFDGEYFLDCCGREKQIAITENNLKFSSRFFHPRNILKDELYNEDSEKKNRSEHFDKVINETLEEIKNLLVVKGKEYRRNNNPYHNFERGAEITNLSKEEVLQGFLLKHIISLEDMRNDLKKGKLPSYDKVQEKYNDCLTYILIEKAMILEQIKNNKSNEI